ncbi:MAG: hypothetical protein K2X39_00940, partial [Silvanigrellaceae bacterium]|nr:hypothetical protein [Silvanigrellaceae bacterium]
MISKKIVFLSMILTLLQFNFFITEIFCSCNQTLVSVHSKLKHPSLLTIFLNKDILDKVNRYLLNEHDAQGFNEDQLRRIREHFYQNTTFDHQDIYSIVLFLSSIEEVPSTKILASLKKMLRYNSQANNFQHLKSLLLLSVKKLFVPKTEIPDNFLSLQSAQENLIWLSVLNHHGEYMLAEEAYLQVLEYELSLNNSKEAFLEKSDIARLKKIVENSQCFSKQLLLRAKLLRAKIFITYTFFDEDYTSYQSIKDLFEIINEPIAFLENEKQQAKWYILRFIIREDIEFQSCYYARNQNFINELSLSKNLNPIFLKILPLYQWSFDLKKNVIENNLDSIEEDVYQLFLKINELSNIYHQTLKRTPVELMLVQDM